MRRDDNLSLQPSDEKKIKKYVETRIDTPTPAPALAPAASAAQEDKYPLFKRIKRSRPFFLIHLLFVLLSFVLPGVLTMHDSHESAVQVGTLAAAIPLLVCHSAINVVVVFNAMNPPENKTLRYALGWLGYEIIKIGLIVACLVTYFTADDAAAAATSDSDSSNSSKIQLSILILLMTEGLHFVVTEFKTPRSIFVRLQKHWPRLAWIIGTQLLIIYIFSFLGYCFFRRAIHIAHETNGFIEGKEFDDIIESFITLNDLKDWYNGYLIRAVEDQIPAAIIFFGVFILIARILDGLLYAVMIDLFSDDTGRIGRTIL